MFRVVAPQNVSQTMVLKNRIFENMPRYFPVEFVMGYQLRQRALVRIYGESGEKLEKWVHFSDLRAIYNVTSEQYYIQRAPVLHAHLLAMTDNDYLIAEFGDLEIPALPNQSSYERNACFARVRGLLTRQEVHQQLAYAWQRLHTQTLIFETVSRNRTLVNDPLRNKQRLRAYRANFVKILDAPVSSAGFMKQKARLAYYLYDPITNLNFVDNRPSILQIQKIVEQDLEKLKTSHLPQIYQEALQDYQQQAQDSVLAHFGFLTHFLIPFAILAKSQLTSFPLHAFQLLSRFFAAFFNDKFVELRQFAIQQFQIKTTYFDIKNKSGLPLQLLSCFEHFKLSSFDEYQSCVLNAKGITIKFNEETQKFNVSENAAQIIDPAHLSTMGLLSNFSIQFLISKELQLAGKVFTKREVENLDQFSTQLKLIDENLEAHAGGILFSNQIYFVVDQMTQLFHDLLSMLLILVDDLNGILSDNENHRLQLFKATTFYQQLVAPFTMQEVQSQITFEDICNFFLKIDEEVLELLQLPDKLQISLFIIDVSQIKQTFIQQTKRSKQNIKELLAHSVASYMLQINTNLEKLDLFVNMETSFQNYLVIKDKIIKINADAIAMQISQFSNILVYDQDFAILYVSTFYKYLKYSKINNKNNKISVQIIRSISMVEEEYLYLFKYQLKMMEVFVKNYHENGKITHTLMQFSHPVSNQHSFLTQNSDDALYNDDVFNFVCRQFNERNYSLFGEEFSQQFIQKIIFGKRLQSVMNVPETQTLIFVDWYGCFNIVKQQFRHTLVMQEIEKVLLNNKQLKLFFNLIFISTVQDCLQQMFVYDIQQLKFDQIIAFEQCYLQMIYDLKLHQFSSDFASSVEQSVIKYHGFFKFCHLTQQFQGNTYFFNDLIKLASKDFVRQSQITSFYDLISQNMSEISYLTWLGDYVAQQVEYKNTLLKIKERLLILNINQFPKTSYDIIQYHEVRLNYAVSKQILKSFRNKYLCDNKSDHITDTIRLMEIIVPCGYQFLLNHIRLGQVISKIQKFTRNSYVCSQQFEINTEFISVKNWQIFEQLKIQYQEATYWFFKNMNNYCQSSLLQRIICLQEVIYNKMTILYDKILKAPFAYVIDYFRINFVQKLEVIIPYINEKYYPLMILNSTSIEDNFKPLFNNDILDQKGLAEALQQHSLYSGITQVKFYKSQVGNSVLSLQSGNESLYMTQSISAPKYISQLPDILGSSVGNSLQVQIQKTLSTYQSLVNSLFINFQSDQNIQIQFDDMIKDSLSTCQLVLWSTILTQNLVENEERCILFIEYVIQLYSSYENESSIVHFLKFVKNQIELKQVDKILFLTRIDNKFKLRNISKTICVNCCSFWSGEFKISTSLFQQYDIFSKILYFQQRNISALVLVTQHVKLILQQIQMLYEQFVQDKVYLLHLDVKQFDQQISYLQLSLILGYKLIITGLEMLSQVQLESLGIICHDIYQQSLQNDRIVYPIIVQEHNQTLVKLQKGVIQNCNVLSLLFICSTTDKSLQQTFIKSINFLKYCALIQNFNDKQMENEQVTFIIEKNQQNTQQEHTMVCQQDFKNSNIDQMSKFDQQFITNTVLETRILINYLFTIKTNIFVSQTTSLLQLISFFRLNMQEYYNMIIAHNIISLTNNLTFIQLLETKTLVVIPFSEASHVVDSYSKIFELLNMNEKIKLLYVSEGSINMYDIIGKTYIQYSKLLYFSQFQCHFRFNFKCSNISSKLANKRAKITHIFLQQFLSFTFNYFKSALQVEDIQQCSQIIDVISQKLCDISILQKAEVVSNLEISNQQVDNQQRLFSEFIFFPQSQLCEVNFMVSNSYEQYLTQLSNTDYVTDIMDKVLVTVVYVFNQFLGKQKLDINNIVAFVFQEDMLKVTQNITSYIFNDIYNQSNFNLLIEDAIKYVSSDQTFSIIWNDLLTKYLKVLQSSEFFCMKIINEKIVFDTTLTVQSIFNQYIQNQQENRYMVNNNKFWQTLDFIYNLIIIHGVVLLNFESEYEQRITIQLVVQKYEKQYDLMFSTIKHISDIDLFLSLVESRFDLLNQGYCYTGLQELVCFLIIDDNIQKTQLIQISQVILLHRLKISQYALLIFCKSQRNDQARTCLIAQQTIVPLSHQYKIGLIHQIFQNTSIQQIQIMYDNIIKFSVKQNYYVDFISNLEYWSAQFQFNFLKTLLFVLFCYFDVDLLINASETCFSLQLANKIPSNADFNLFSKFYRQQSICFPQQLLDILNVYFNSIVEPYEVYQHTYDPLLFIQTQQYIQYKLMFHTILLTSQLPNEEDQIFDIIIKLNQQSQVKTIQVSHYFNKVITRSYDHETVFNEAEPDIYFMKLQSSLFNIIMEDSPDFIVYFFIFRILFAINIGINPMLVLPDSLHYNTKLFHFFQTPLMRTGVSGIQEGYYNNLYISAFAIPFNTMQKDIKKFLKLDNQYDINPTVVSSLDFDYVYQQQGFMLILDQFCVQCKSQKHQCSIQQLLQNTTSNNCQPALFSPEELQNINIILSQQRKNQIYDKFQYKHNFKNLRFVTVIPFKTKQNYYLGSVQTAKYFSDAFKYTRLVDANNQSQSNNLQELFTPSIQDFFFSIRKQSQIYAKQDFYSLLYHLHFKDYHVDLMQMSSLYQKVENYLSDAHIMFGLNYFCVNIVNQILTIFDSDIGERVIYHKEPKLMQNKQFREKIEEFQQMAQQCMFHYLSKVDKTQNISSGINQYVNSNTFAHKEKVLFSLFFQTTENVNTYICHQNYSQHLGMLLLIFRNRGLVLEIEKQLTIVECNLPYQQFCLRLQRVFETSTNIVLFINTDSIQDLNVLSALKTLQILRYQKIKQKQFIQLSYNAISLYQDLAKYIFILSYGSTSLQSNLQDQLFFDNVSCKTTYLQLNFSKNQDNNIQKFQQLCEEFKIMSANDNMQNQKISDSKSIRTIQLFQTNYYEVRNSILKLYNYHSYQIMLFNLQIFYNQMCNEKFGVYLFNNTNQHQYLKQQLAIFKNFIYCNYQYETFDDVLLFLIQNKNTILLKSILFIIIKSSNRNYDICNFVNDDYNFDFRLMQMYLKAQIIQTYDNKLESIFDVLLQHPSFFAYFTQGVTFTEMVRGGQIFQSIELPFVLQNNDINTEITQFILNLFVRQDQILAELHHTIDNIFQKQLKSEVSSQKIKQTTQDVINLKYSNDLSQFEQYFVNDDHEFSKTFPKLKLPTLFVQLSSLFQNFLIQLNGAAKGKVAVHFVEYSYQVQIQSYVELMISYLEDQRIKEFSRDTLDSDEQKLLYLVVQDNNLCESKLQLLLKTLFEQQIGKMRREYPLVIVIIMPNGFNSRSSDVGYSISEPSTLSQIETIQQILLLFHPYLSSSNILEQELSAQELFFHLLLLFVILFRSLKTKTPVDRKGSSQLHLILIRNLICFFMILYKIEDAIISDRFTIFVIQDFFEFLQNSENQKFALNMDIPNSFDEVTKNIVDVVSDEFKHFINAGSSMLESDVFCQSQQVIIEISKQLDKEAPREFPDFLLKELLYYLNSKFSRNIDCEGLKYMLNQLYPKFLGELVLKEQNRITFQIQGQINSFNQIANLIPQMQIIFDNSAFLQSIAISDMEHLSSRILFTRSLQNNPFQFADRDITSYIQKHRYYKLLDIGAFTPRFSTTDYFSHIIPSIDLEFIKTPRVGKYIPIVSNGYKLDIAAPTFHVILGDILDHYKRYHEKRLKCNLRAVTSLYKPEYFLNIDSSGNKMNAGEAFYITIINMKFFRAVYDQEYNSICDRSEQDVQELLIYYYLVKDERADWEEQPPQGWVAFPVRAGGQPIPKVPVKNRTPFNDDYWKKRCCYFGILII